MRATLECPQNLLRKLHTKREGKKTVTANYRMPLLFLVAVLHITVFESCFLSEMEGSWVKEVSLWCVKNTNKVCCSQFTLKPKPLALTSPPHIPALGAHLTGCDLDAVLASLFHSLLLSLHQYWGSYFFKDLKTVNNKKLLSWQTLLSS